MSSNPTPDHLRTVHPPRPPSAADPHRCPLCDARLTEAEVAPRRHDEDYDYYWGDVRVPQWIALILNVPRRQQLDILLFGFVIGLIVAGLALLWGLILAY